MYLKNKSQKKKKFDHLPCVVVKGVDSLYAGTTYHLFINKVNEIEIVKKVPSHPDTLKVFELYRLNV